MAGGGAGGVRAAIRRGARRVEAPAGLPRELGWVFWTGTALIGGMLGVDTVGFVRDPSSAPPVLFAVNLALVVLAWHRLFRPTPSPTGRPVMPLLFLVATLALGSTGTAGEQQPVTLVALTVLAVTWGLRASAVAMLLIDGLGVVLEQGLDHVDPWTSARRAVLFAAAQVFVLAMVRAVQSSRQARAEAEDLNRRLRDLTIAQERGRMAAEMHDTVGHDLMVVTLDLQNALRLRHRDPAAAWEQVAQARSDVGLAVEHVRRAVRALRPLDLTGRRLSAALTDLACSFDGTGVTISVAIDDRADHLDPEQQVVVLRAVQEGLLNAVRHSDADRIDVQLRCTDDVHLTIADNGDGADDERLARGFGLRQLADRARAHDGVLHVDGTQGVRLTLRLPGRAAS